MIEISCIWSELLLQQKIICFNRAVGWFLSVNNIEFRGVENFTFKTAQILQTNLEGQIRCLYAGLRCVVIFYEQSFWVLLQKYWRNERWMNYRLSWMSCICPSLSFSFMNLFYIYMYKETFHLMFEISWYHVQIWTNLYFSRTLIK